MCICQNSGFVLQPVISHITYNEYKCFISQHSPLTMKKQNYNEPSAFAKNLYASKSKYFNKKE